jgi:hypothetical protein
LRYFHCRNLQGRNLKEQTFHDTFAHANTADRFFMRKLNAITGGVESSGIFAAGFEQLTGLY